MYAVDTETFSPDFLDDREKERFHFTDSTFERFAFPVSAFDLVNASYSLPFSPPESSKV